MVDETDTPSARQPELTPGPTSTRREKPVIEGERVSEEVIAPDPPHPDAADAAQDAPPQPIAEDETAKSEPAPDNSGAVPRRRGSLWPIAAAIVIGAGLAVGGAFALRSLDTNAEDTAARDAREAKVTARLAALEKKPDTGAGLAETVAAQEKRIKLAEEAAREAVNVAKFALATAQKAQNGATAPAPQEQQAPQPQAVDLTPLQSQIGDLAGRLTEFDQKLAQLAAPAEPKSEMRLPEDKAVPPAAKSSAEAVAIIAEILAGKVERGAAYAPELSALANLGIDKAKLAALEPGATTGVATTSALAAQFAAVASTLLASEPKKVEGSFFDRLAESAGRLVRKVGDVSGDDLPARMARINAALRAGTVDAALAEWNDLPAWAKDKSQAFASAAKIRVDALAAARTIETEAVAALGKPKS